MPITARFEIHLLATTAIALQMLCAQLTVSTTGQQSHHSVGPIGLTKWQIVAKVNASFTVANDRAEAEFRVVENRGVQVGLVRDVD